ncbi:Patatin-like phospholipase [compost metagenome]
MQKTKLPNGIQHIALSFSGGGFRAATFTLGCASYLNALPYGDGKLWDKVRFISSASGGSITALVLGHMLSQGKDFQTVYEHLLSKMDGDQLMKRVFHILETDHYWTQRPTKNRNLINAFAIAYDEDFFDHATYGQLMETSHPGAQRIDEICINTTEFNNGQNFRFGTRGTVGNKYLSLSKAQDQDDDEQNNLDIVKKIRLGDILASSSCFPGGFEPLVYPKDFSWNSSHDALTWKQLGSVLRYSSHYSNKKVNLKIKQEMASFMDGGIDDNQAIYAFLKASKRKGKGYDYDLYLPCDVSSNYLPGPWTYPPTKPEGILSDTLLQWQRRLKRYRTTFITTTTLVLLGAIALLWFTQKEALSYFLLGLGLGAATLSLIAYRWTKNTWKSFKAVFATTEDHQKGTWELIWEKYRGEIFKMSLRDLLNMAQARASSVFLLVDTVYLKKIRRMSYDTLFTDYRAKTDIDESGSTLQLSEAESSDIVENNNQKDSEKKPSWENKIGVTAIYLLSTKNDWKLQETIKGQPWDLDTYTVNSHGKQELLATLLQPSATLRTHIDLATEMETTLWFDDYHMEQKAKENLLIAGQATMCFNLLLITHRIDSPKPEWLLLKERLLEDWQLFNQRPEKMIR